MEGEGGAADVDDSRAPVARVVDGYGAQYQGCWEVSKCSAEKSWTGASSANAVPIAFVPTTDSDQWAPSTKPSPSACRLAREAPSRQRMTPSASVTTRMKPAEAGGAEEDRPEFVDDEAQLRPVPAGLDVGLGGVDPTIAPAGVEAEAEHPRHERATMSRGGDGGGPPVTTASWILVRSLARCARSG